MRKAHEEALIRAKAANVNVPPDGDLTFLKSYYPNWMREEYWVTLIDKLWNTPKWKLLSQSWKQNRNKQEDGSISKHKGGSISARQHKIKMEAILKRLPTGVEVYEQLHTKKSTKEFITPKAANVKEAYESAMVAKFGDDTTSHPLLDNETRCGVTGGVKKGRVFGFGSVSDPASLLSGTSSTIRAPQDLYERVQEQMREEINMKAVELEAKHQQMREEIDAKTAALDAKSAQLEAQQKQMHEDMKKMHAAMQNMRES
ncbi:hypothetical protein L2E82_10638 [Cichorium intybus]|uniref:Uncharacterized protein n=1 Tax=Cichorium intybus TaxID=13427 RepID=A0ACB9GAZ2_CICIN|nr:hypothetical protein L2E82_10638 [Cichorium intybus]